jgi:LmbE family N-acetylglucosaminyl deacetylase
LLIVTAHPADSFDQAGGTIAHHVEQGDTATALMLTTGVRSHDWQLLDARRRGEAGGSEADVAGAVDKKEREAREACAILGITDLRFIEMEDDLVLVTRELVTAIAKVIREVRPHIVITSHPYEDGGIANPHAATSHATINALHMAGSMPIGDDAEPHGVASIYFMNPTQGIIGNPFALALHGHIDLYVDISDVIEKKVRALDCIRSQHYHGHYARKRAETSDGYYGVAAGVPYAEPFQRYRPLVTRTLPVTEFELATSNEPVGDSLSRYSRLQAYSVPMPDDEPFMGPAQRYVMPS